MEEDMQHMWSSLRPPQSLCLRSSIRLSEVAVLVQGLTALLVFEEARAKADDTVLISAAAGGVGSIAVQIAKAKNVKVIGLASASKLELVRSLGAEHVFDYNQPGWSSAPLEDSR